METNETTSNYCSYGFYCRQITKMKISFAHLGNEKCEDCDSFFIHSKETSHSKHELPNMQICKACDTWYLYKTKSWASTFDKESICI